MLGTFDRCLIADGSYSNFEEAVAYQAVCISSLDIDRRYEIRSAEKVMDNCRAVG